jgi:hypothetical protein
MGCGGSKARELEPEVETVLYARRRSIQAGGTGELMAGLGQVGLEMDKGRPSPFGFFSNHGWARKTNMLTGAVAVKPKVNQDRIFVTPALCGKEDAWLFACYDGNGPQGEEVADEVGIEMVKMIENFGKEGGA